MSRKLIALVVLVLAVIVAGSIGLNYARSFKTVSVDIKREGVSATIKDDKGKTVKEISEGAKTTSVKIRKGTYSVVPKGTNIESQAIPLTVSDAGGGVVVDPGYSRGYLQNLLKAESAAIKSLLADTYPGTISAFTINTGRLYLYGDWYATTLVEQSPGPGATGDVYRTVLHKEDGEWKVVAAPEIVLTTKNHPTVPRPILDEINLETGY